MDFIVIDVETANSNLSSICQVGIAIFSDGKFAESWSSLVNPKDYFDDINVSKIKKKESDKNVHIIGYLGYSYSSFSILYYQKV
jgi:DNA polymerase III epsilon subunit-like protein